MTGPKDFETGGGLRQYQTVVDGDHDPLIGCEFGSYTLQDLVAEGGMGRVYRAARSDGQFQREVAVKVLGAGLGTEYVKRFEQERQILAQLSHPNIAQLLDAGLAETGNLYLVMELIEGETIDSHAAAKELTIRQKAELMATLCEALAFAHARLVVHRDLKPSNVMVTRDGTLKLLDFGIAKILEAPEGITEQNRPLTLRYASPEQLLDEPVSVASDIFQWGLLFLALFEESDRKVRDTPAAAADRALKRVSIDAESQISTRLPPDLLAILNRCLRAEPAERYSSAGELADDLRRFLRGFPVTARNPGAAQRIGKFLRRNWLPSALTAAFIATVVAATTFYVLSIKQSRRAADLANQRAQTEAAVATSTTDFLLRMISGGNAMLTPEEPQTVPEAIARGAELLRTELADQPAVRARLANALGTTLNGIQKWQQSKTMLEAVIPELLEDPAVDTAQRLELLATVAYANYRLSAFSQARQQYQELIEMHQSAGLLATATYAGAWRRLGLLERRASNTDLALEHMREAERAYGRIDAGEILRASFLGDYGLVLSDAGEHELAIEKYRQSSALFREVQGDLCTSCAINWINLSWPLKNLGRYEEALEKLEQADQVYRRQLGDSYGYSEAGILQNKSSVKQKMGRYDEAIADQTRAIEIYRDVVGPDHATYATALFNLGSTHRQHDRCDLALAPLRRARDIHAQVLGETSDWVARSDRAIRECEPTPD